jgi:hypothetical protein
MGFEGTAEEWNHHFPIGTIVIWDGHICVTSSLAKTIEGFGFNETVMLQGIDNPVSLSELTVSPENPEVPVRHRRGRSQNATSRSMASGRQNKANTSIIMSAVELAALCRRMATHSLALNEVGFRDEAVRILALAASIEGVVGMGDPSGVKGMRAFFGDLVVGECYLTHFQGRSEDWSYAGVNNDDRMILIEVGGKQKIVASADYGLCAYDGGSGAWHPFVWTEKIGLNINDGKSVADMVDDEANLTELEDEDNIF